MKALKKRILTACCGAHILHDGYTDLLYVMFPIWQMAFGLSLAEVGSLKNDAITLTPALGAAWSG